MKAVISTPDVHKLTDHLFRHESAKIVAVLTRLFGLHNLAMAEDVMQDAFAAALKDWVVSTPANPSGWLMLTAKNKAIDLIRRERYKREFAAETTVLLRSEYTTAPMIDRLFLDHEIQDSQLRMIFACCHPDLSEADQIALTLKTCSGFGVQEIAAAMLANSETIKKRLQRARATIAGQQMRFDIPGGQELQRRLDTVMHTIYLIFNEGYNSGNKEELIRKDLCEEALRLALLLTQHPYTNHPKCFSLVALMTLLSSRFDCRIDDCGEIILLEDQDRSKWNRELIEIGLGYLERGSAGEELSEYHIEAAIVAQHTLAPTFADTNWHIIHVLYNRLNNINPSPAVMLNKAIVAGKLYGALHAIDEIMLIEGVHKLCDTHYLFPAVLGDLYMQLCDKQQARVYFEKARTLTSSPAEQKLISKKMAAL